jgi:hypothetical protein
MEEKLNININLAKETRLSDNAEKLAELLKRSDVIKEEIVDLKEIVLSDLPEDFEEHKIQIAMDTDLVIKTPPKYDWDKERLAEIVGSADLEQYSDVVTKSLSIAKRDFDKAEPEVRAILSEALTIKRGITTFKVTNNG